MLDDITDNDTALCVTDAGKTPFDISEYINKS